MLKPLRVGMYGVIKKMHNDCDSCIQLNVSLSEKNKCETGVRKGDVLSKFFLNLYIGILDISEGDFNSPMMNNLLVDCLTYGYDLVLLFLT